MNITFFDNWNVTIRWILFLPMLFIGYIISFFVGKFVLYWTLGMIGLEEETVLGFLISHLYSSMLCFMIPIIISVACAPKGKVIIASIYAGLILMLFGFSLFSLIVYGDIRPTWQVLYDYILNVVGAILALVSIILEEKEKSNNELNETFDM